MPENHDLFLIGHADDKRDLTHIKVDQRGVPTTIHENVGLEYPGRRKVMNLAQSGPEDSGRGTGFSILPMRPDPASSQMSCYLINPHNLRDVNPWTVAEWSQAEDEKDEGLRWREDPSVFESPAFELLLAGPMGEVYFVRKNADGGATIDQLSKQSLARESELWHQLRNGMVAGSVSYAGHPDEPGRAVAVVNMTAVLPRVTQPTEPGGSQP